jgi:hypothetical protein
VSELSSPVEERDKSLQSERRRQIRRQIRGSLWIAGGALLFAILRAGVHRVFGPGWWRLW